MADPEQLAVALAEQPRELDAIAEHIDNDDVTSLAMALDPQPSWVRTEAPLPPPSALAKPPQPQPAPHPPCHRQRRRR